MTVLDGSSRRSFGNVHSPTTGLPMPLLPLQASAPSVVMRLLKDIGQVFPFQKSSSTPPPPFRFGSLSTNALHLCCHRGKQMLQRCPNLRVRWSDIFQRDQSLALSAHHFDLYPMKCWGDSMHFRKPQLGVHADRGNGTCYSGQRFIYRIRTSTRKAS